MHLPNTMYSYLWPYFAPSGAIERHPRAEWPPHGTSGHSPPSSLTSNKGLKFGIDWILSDDSSHVHKDSTSQSPQAWVPLCVGNCLGPFLRCHCDRVVFSPAWTLPSGVGGSRRRRGAVRRAVFSEDQRQGLELAFQKTPYVCPPERQRLATRLGLRDTQVKIWFQNRRMKWRNSQERRQREPEKGTKSESRLDEGVVDEGLFSTFTTQPSHNFSGEQNRFTACV
uniref:Homeobox domain-containing protein n=1 Tax=Eptatretus burgeri TaxID=7764 RepID=A0A8C4RAC9_EPTBU